MLTFILYHYFSNRSESRSRSRSSSHIEVAATSYRIKQLYIKSWKKRSFSSPLYNTRRGQTVGKWMIKVKGKSRMPFPSKLNVYFVENGRHQAVSGYIGKFMVEALWRSRASADDVLDACLFDVQSRVASQ